MENTLQDTIRADLKSRLKPKAEGYSLRDIAMKTGLTVTTVSNFLRNESISGKSLDAIAKFLEETK